MTQLGFVSGGGLRPVMGAVVTVCGIAAAQAQQMPAASVSTDRVQVAQAVPVLKPVVVSASRDEQDADTLPMSIDVVDAVQMEQSQISDIRELASQLPNVDVPRGPARFSLAGSSTGRAQNSGFNIRGLEGNRVLMLMDGVRLPRGYSFSANAFGRDYLDLGLVQRVEVLRGSVPALYGSDGMGGLVNFVSVQPSDVLGDGKNFGGRITASYDGSDSGKRLGAVLAGRPDAQWSWLLAAGLGRAHELENMGTNHVQGSRRTAPNPERDKSHSLLGRLVYAPSGVQKHVFTLEQVDKRADYDLLTARGSSGMPGMHCCGGGLSGTHRDGSLACILAGVVAAIERGVG